MFKTSSFLFLAALMFSYTFASTTKFMQARRLVHNEHPTIGGCIDNLEHCMTRRHCPHDYLKKKSQLSAFKLASCKNCEITYCSCKKLAMVNLRANLNGCVNKYNLDKKRCNGANRQCLNKCRDRRFRCINQVKNPVNYLHFRERKTCD